jgi:hypothetical protein
MKQEDRTKGNGMRLAALNNRLFERGLVFKAFRIVFGDAAKTTTDNMIRKQPAEW